MMSPRRFLMVRMMIRTEHLTKKYKSLTAVNDLNLTLNDDSLFALLGTNGAGKTTTIKMLSTLITPTSGNIYYDNYSLPKDTQVIRNFINLSPQETAIAANLSVKENLEFMAGVYGIQDKARINHLIEVFHLDEVLKQKAATLSGGWQRKLSIALSLINQPKILFLDEPTLGLDVIARKELWNVIESLKKEMLIILTTHYMEEAEELADQVGIITHGRLITPGTVSDLLQQTNTTKLEDAFVKLVMEEKQ